MAQHTTPCTGVRHHLACEMGELTQLLGTQFGPMSHDTTAILLDEIGDKLSPLDLSERVESFRFIAPTELPVLTERLSHLERHYDSQITGDWHDWGQFRAVIHQAVWEALQGKM